MNYVILDLEFNQAFPFKTGRKFETVSDCPFEIIQIGAVKLDENLNTIGTFNAFIQPTLYRRLHPFVEKITGIREKQLENQPFFPEAYDNFVRFIGAEDAVLCTWGTDDVKSLFRNVYYHKLDTNTITHRYIDIQSYASNYLNYEAGKAIGLKNAILALSLESEIPFHDALNDAIYTARVFQIVRPEKINLMTFQPTILLVKKTKTARISTRALMKHIEDTIQRELTSEEKKLIKMSYILGQNHAFDITAPLLKKKHTTKNGSTVEE